MRRVILTTVGTSLNGNVNNPKVNSDGMSRADLLRERPRDACAEANVLDRLLQSGDAVELFHSETTDGKECAEEIAAWLIGRGYDTKRVPIEGLTYRAVDFHRGLRSLVRHLAGRIRALRREGREPVLNALGGFKSEIAYATLVGALFDLPNYYIHQSFDELLTIPPLPVGWDIARIDAYSETLSYLNAEQRTSSDAHSRLQALPNDLRQTLTEDDADGFIYLSPMGEACFEAYQARIEQADISGAKLYLSRSAAKTLEDSEPSTRQAFENVLRRLRVPEIRRQGGKTLQQNNGDALKFPQGRVNERVFWFEEEDAVYVLEITRHDRRYDELHRKGVFRNSYDPNEWRLWQAG